MILIVIPAKGGSNRLPNKNMTPLNGRPLIDYAVEQARASRRAQRIVVSTDSDAIARHVEVKNVEVVRRPVNLGGEVPLLDVYRHACEALGGIERIDVLVGVQPDHPDRDVPLDAALAEFEKAGADLLYSTQADGTKNGAHYILSRHMLATGEPRRKVGIVDDCTNIHYPADLERAAARLRARIALA